MRHSPTTETSGVLCNEDCQTMWLAFAYDGIVRYNYPSDGLTDTSLYRGPAASDEIHLYVVLAMNVLLAASRRAERSISPVTSGTR